MIYDHTATIVVPVYGDWSSLKECIESLKLYVGRTQHKIILINDCGPEADTIEANIQKSINGLINFTYYRNKKNLGFVGTCNRAVLELDDSNNNILLLNSDTRATKGFLEEMIRVLYSDDKNGAVTPRSNNATIATMPLSSASQKGIDPQKSYDIFKKIAHKLPHYSVAPVAHGFCMLIRRDLIKKYGLFDPIFGRGYGEEVDFCQRIASHGYNSVVANHAFVFHLEARSFTLSAKAKHIKNNNRIIWQRYPNYRQQVRDYMQEAVAKEQQILRSAGLSDTNINRESLIKKLVKRNKKIYKLAHAIRRSIKK